MTIDPWTIFISAAITVLAGMAVRGVFQVGNALAGMRKSIDRLIQTDQDQTLAIGALAKLQRPCLAAHKATLEAIRDGKSNGNVTSAHQGVEIAFSNFEEFLTGRL
jgi:hypothetical protein